ncbi:divalent-cation tolerance protein CutA [Oleisolibacter albus]|uniref:divalent-cation tolerance protein CutA n=1 Tax=Oleisolibacter albus TaxID=2171757 RepID=UPI000DF49C02|nr:divalent-cation tolerance protein CutA [Oleisolibacter albus]
MADFVLVYITAGSVDEATRIGRALVEERLAACANVIPSMHSIYRWDDAVQEAEETILIAKTMSDRYVDLAMRVRALHSYDVPCILMLPVGAGDPDYLSWLRRGSRPAAA